MSATAIAAKYDKVAFLDRDGIINFNAPDRGYVRSREEFILNPEVLPLLHALQAQGFALMIITNQQGVGKGLMGEHDLAVVHDHMLELLNSHGIAIEAVYYCPHLAAERCRCRKPAPGMILDAMEKHSIDRERSIFIGDSLTDAQAGQRAGVRTFLLVGDDVDERAEIDATDAVAVTHLKEIPALL